MIVEEETTVFGDPPQPVLDLTTCYLEPIHIPGTIQPHGAMLAARIDNLLVTHASANLATILGIPAKTALGRPLQETLGAAACHAFARIADQNGNGLGHADAELIAGGAPLHLRAYRVDRLLCVDIEPILVVRQGLPGVMAQAILETFKQATTRAELCELAVRGLKALTGYDRVLAYRFDDAGHGEVVAEAREESLEPYLGLRYPASDIPHQARRQYLLQRVGAIGDSGYRPVPMLSHPTLHDGTPLDMTHCSLRGISPVHLEYMRNMSTAASLTIGLAHQQKLWGMLVCHHRTPRLAGVELRAAADIIGQVVSLLLSSLGQTEAYAKRFDQSDTLRSLIGKLATPTPLMDAFALAEEELLKLVHANGAIVRLAGTLLFLGRTPPGPATQTALTLLHQAADGEVLAVEDLGLRYPQLADCTTDGSGALLLPLPQTADDAILWFRPELSQNVVWGGNPNESNKLDPATGRLSPRVSFASWKEIIRGHSAPWRDADLAHVRELRSAIEVEMAQRTKAELAKLRNYDSLTGLPNRRLFQSRLAESDEHLDRASLSLLFLDLDRFKEVNDTMGHAAGDALLVQVAKRITAEAGPQNLVARLGGDEFVVLCHGQRQAVTALGERIRLSIEAPFDISGRACLVSVSVGIARADELAELDLLRAADMAMYAAKKSGGNAFCFFDLEMSRNAMERVGLELELHQALAAGEIEVHYQPIVSIETRRKVGAEALVRWRHPVHGLILPDRFIPLAEKTGLINPLGELVLRQACIDAVKWPSFTKVAVNLSPIQFQSPHLASNIARILAESKLPPERLELEITESVLLQRSDNNAGTLHELHDLGVSIALDDFGTGYSSLSYLRMFPFDNIKIDRLFVSEMSQVDSCAAIVCAVANLGRSLDIITTAEGVETEEQLELVRAAGCTQAQGYLFGRPCPVANLDFDMEVAWTPAEKGAALTPRDVMLVRTSFALVVPIQDAIAALFYDRLFAARPELRRLFPADLSGQKRKLMALLATCVGKLQDFSTLAPLIKGLGARHVVYGAKTEHYAIVGEALLWALKQGLDDAFTLEIQSAWTKVYKVIAETMQAGAAEAAVLKAAS